MNLREAFAEIGPAIQVAPDTLLAYAGEDTVGGYEGGAGAWPIGSLWSVEGQFLYALVRALKPRHVLEIGTHAGCSATHILTALQTNHSGHLTSLDIEPLVGDGPPMHLRNRWTFVQAEAVQWLTAHQPQADLVFEDGFHTLNGTLSILETVQEVTRPQVVLSHDAAHQRVGPAVQRAFAATFQPMTVTLMAPSDCGLAWWVRGT
jgi:hypothetical protein